MLRCCQPDASPPHHPGYALDDGAHHAQHLPPLSEALHPDDGSHYTHPSSAYGADHRDSTGHVSYDHTHSSNFFDPQLVDTHASSGGGASANGNNYTSSSMMTPPPATTAHSAYSSSSPYQSAPMFHRASISGPVMNSHYAVGAPSSAQAATASGDVWSTAAAVRPHTADGLFGLPGQWGIPGEYSRAPRGSVSSIMSDTPSTSGNGKVFSYMSNGDDLSTTSSGGGAGHSSSGGPRKRPRRRFDEIERLYTCKWPGCQKSYGTLNHLNAHVAMQKHGSKRSPAEFKEMRKAWRKGKREDEQRRQANQAAANEDALARKGMMFTAPGQPFMTHSAGGGAAAGGGAGNGAFPMPMSSSFGPPQSTGSAQHMMAPPSASVNMGSTAGSGQIPRFHAQQSSANNSAMYGGGAGGFAQPAAAGGQGSGGLGAYLMAHRGSI